MLLCNSMNLPLNLISKVKPMKCTSFSNLFYFGTALYMLRTAFPSIIRSLRLYIQHQVYVEQILLTACQREGDGAPWSSISFVLASIQQILFDIYLMLYVQSQTPDDRRKDLPKHVQCCSKKKIKFEILCIWLVLLQKYITVHVPINVKNL